MWQAIAAAVGMQILGKMMSNSAQRAQMRREADMEDAAAAIALQDGAYEAWQRNMKGSQEEASAVASVAAQGVDTSVGSAAGAIGNVRLMSAIDVARIRVNASQVAWSHRERAWALRKAAEPDILADMLGMATPAVQGYAQYSAIGKAPNAAS